MIKNAKNHLEIKLHSYLFEKKNCNLNKNMAYLFIYFLDKLRFSHKRKSTENHKNIFFFSIFHSVQFKN